MFGKVLFMLFYSERKSLGCDYFMPQLATTLHSLLSWNDASPENTSPSFGPPDNLQQDAGKA